MSSWLLKGVRLPERAEPVDVLLDDGVIAAIEPGLSHRGATRARGRRTDGAAGPRRSAHAPARARPRGRRDGRDRHAGCGPGGYTAVHAMANTDPVADSAGVVEQVWLAGRDAGHCDVHPVGAVSVGLRGEQLAELGAMADSHARVRVFSDDGKCVSDALLMRRALEYVKAFDGVIAQHAQEPRLTEDAQMNESELSGVLGLRGWPAVAEEAIIARDILLTEHVGSRLHICHISTAGSVELVRWAKARGVNVTAEVTPHHLLLTDELAATYDPLYKVNPPLRSRDDVEAVRQGLADGTIDAVATDHAPHALGRQGNRVAGRIARHARAGDCAVGRGAGDGRDRAARLGRSLRSDVDATRPHRPAVWPRAADCRWRAGEPGADRPSRATRRRSARARVEVPQYPLCRSGAACARRPYLPAVGSYRSRREAGMTALLSASASRVACARRRSGVSRRVLRRRRRDVRRSRLRDRHDRLPGDADRSELSQAGRGDDRAAHRQHRRQRRGRRVVADLGQRLRRSRSCPRAVELAIPPNPR